MLDAASASINGDDGEATERSPLLGGEGRSWRDWARTYRWYIAAGVGVGLAVTAVATGCGVYFGLRAASTPAAGNTTATPTTPDFTPTTAPSSVGTTGSTQLSTFSTPVIVSSSTGPTSSGTVTMSTMTTERTTSLPSRRVCAQQPDVLFPMEIDQFSDEVVCGQETTIDNVFFGMKGSSSIKITGLQAGDRIYAFGAFKDAIGPDQPLEMGDYVEETDIAIVATNAGSRDLKITATNGDGETLICRETVDVVPQPDATAVPQPNNSATAFYDGEIPDVVTAPESTVGAVAGG